ncbi:MAG: cation:proton antiporter domain-containing protein [Anaerolineae bacterium]
MRLVSGIVLILGLGLVACRLSDRLVGLIPLGIGLGPFGLNLLDPGTLSLSGGVCTIALILILLRAGIGLDLRALNGLRGAALRLGLLPFGLEAALLFAIAYRMLQLPLIEAAMAGIILAAAAPAIIVPAMLDLQARGIGAERQVPPLIVAANALENVVGVTLFGALSSSVSAPAQASWGLLARVPLALLGGVALGFASGYLISLALTSRSLLHPAERLFLVVAGAIGVALIARPLGLAGYASVTVLGLVLNRRAPRESADLVRLLDPLWYVVQLFLFTLIGAQADLGMLAQVGAVGVVAIAAGLVARTVGVRLALARTGLRSQEVSFCAVALMPKATVQAAIGGVPLALGLASGGPILALAMLTIIVTGPLGASAIAALAPRWLSCSESGGSSVPGTRSPSADVTVAGS